MRKRNHLGNNSERKEPQISAAFDFLGDRALMTSTKPRTGPGTNLTALS